MTQQMPVIRERFPSTAFLKRWIAPACVASLGVGALVGAVWYRYDVPVVTTQGFTSTVTQTTTAPPSTLPAETRVVKETVTAPAAPPELKTAVVTVTKTETPAPETVAVERRKGGNRTETETETVTVTQPAPALFNAGIRGERRNGSQ